MDQTHPLAATTISRDVDGSSAQTSKGERLARARASVIAHFGAAVLIDVESASEARRRSQPA